jgi:hypothetical protein
VCHFCPGEELDNVAVLVGRRPEVERGLHARPSGLVNNGGLKSTL